jgi:hypothetical protein
VFDGAIHTARVVDTRPLSGENAATPRVVAALPFQDRSDTSRFADDYSCQAQVRGYGGLCFSWVNGGQGQGPLRRRRKTAQRALSALGAHGAPFACAPVSRAPQDSAPDVVYSITPQHDMQVGAPSSFQPLPMDSRGVHGCLTPAPIPTPPGHHHHVRVVVRHQAHPRDLPGRPQHLPVQRRRPLLPPQHQQLAHRRRPQGAGGARPARGAARAGRGGRPRAPLRLAQAEPPADRGACWRRLAPLLPCAHARLQAQTTHYVVVDGYYRSSGEYLLSITCNECAGGSGGDLVNGTAIAATTPAGGGGAASGRRGLLGAGGLGHARAGCWGGSLCGPAAGSCSAEAAAPPRPHRRHACAA